MQNTGYIYKITNQINGKVYIGQTKRPIKQRWWEHKNAAKNKNNSGYNYPLYRAFRKYGIHNFKIEEIEKCTYDKLDEREIYWIKYFNSFHNGYNLTLGGEGGKTLELNEQDVVAKYNELKVIEQVAKYFNCSSEPIKNILIKHNIRIPEITYKVIQYTTNKKVIKIYNNLTEAAQYFYDNKKSKTQEAAKLNIRKAILFNTLAYGYYWDSEEMKNKEDKRQKILLTSKKSNKRRINKETCENFCPICGNKMAKKSKLCIDCENKQRKEEAIKVKEQKGITREFLKQEIRNKPFTTIAKEQNVTDKCISKWCKKFDLPYTKREINKYSDEEWKLI